MARKKHTLLLLFGVFILLTGSYFGIVKYKENKEAQKSSQESAEQEANIIRVTQMDEVSKISYNNGAEDLSFIKKEDTWYYEPDESCPLSQTLLHSLANTLGELTAVRKLEGAESLEAYGLDNPVYTVTVEDESGNVVTLGLGNETDTNYYLKVEGSDSIYTVESTLTTSLQNGLYDWIEMESFPTITADEIQKIEVSTADKKQVFDKELREVETTESAAEGESESEVETQDTGSSTVEPTTEEVWYVTENESTRTEATNSTTTDYFISMIVDLTFQSCKDYNASEEELATYGLKDPSATLTVHYVEDEEEKSITLYIGNKDETGNYYYVKMDDSTAVNTVTLTTINNLITKSLEDFVE